ncbi:hypothetical protein PC116_g8579 [Phytophthora cactorum]|nr:hypothetical protein PC119_g5605 [Phytophthora cactorum]KAG4057209.1 hypothetical protein PC123_g7762 [Phytophthora cactorum]KAG4243565.1 hypothetical protein PC116_g8579 [Phytophthora cactorum]
MRNFTAKRIGSAVAAPLRLAPALHGVVVDRPNAVSLLASPLSYYFRCQGWHRIGRVLVCRPSGSILRSPLLPDRHPVHLPYTGRASLSCLPGEDGGDDG